MLRVLTPSEQFCLTEDAQALIYKYRNHKWISPRLLEDLITEVVTIARLRHVPADGTLVDAVLRNMGDVLDASMLMDSEENRREQSLPLS